MSSGIQQGCDSFAQRLECRRQREIQSLFAQAIVLRLDELANVLPARLCAILAKQQRLSVHRPVVLTRQEPPGIDSVLVNERRDDVEDNIDTDGQNLAVNHRSQIFRWDAQLRGRRIQRVMWITTDHGTNSFRDCLDEQFVRTLRVQSAGSKGRMLARSANQVQQKIKTFESSVRPMSM